MLCEQSRSKFCANRPSRIVPGGTDFCANRPGAPTDRSFLRRPWYLFAILNCFQNVGTEDFGNHFWIAGNVVRDSQTVMHTKSLRKKSAMVYGSTRGDRKFHCIIGNHRYDFSQETPSHINCFVTELGLTQSLPLYKSRGCKVQKNITPQWGTFPDIRMLTDLVGCVLACPAADTYSVFRL